MTFHFAPTAVVLSLGLSLTGCSRPSVEQHTWVLESLADESAPVDSVLGMMSEFSLSDGTVTGSGGVNSFNGAYELAGEDISFGPLASTRMASRPDAMEQETRFLQALKAAAHVQVRDEKMTLSDGDNTVLMLLTPAVEG